MDLLRQKTVRQIPAVIKIERARGNSLVSQSLEWPIYRGGTSLTFRFKYISEVSPNSYKRDRPNWAVQNH